MERVYLDFTYILRNSGNVGKLLSTDEIEKISTEVHRAHREIMQERLTKDELSFLSLPYAYEEKYGSTILHDALWKAKDDIEQKASFIKNNCTDYVQIAIGGSALGAIALINAMGHELVVRGEPCDCTIHTPDNIDPEWIAKIINSIRIEDSFFAIMSKSGGTVETLANFFVFYNALRRKVRDKQLLRDHVVIVTNPEKGALADLSREEGFTLIPVPDSVHGRFSVLSPSGLLTAAVSGINMDELLEGARVMDKLTEELPFWQNPMLLYASIHYVANTRKNIDTLVLMPYSQRLRKIADWYSQLVAESLGKDGKGITPVKALGSTDQHSQLQLYNQGPKNKLVTFFCVDKFTEFIEIPEEFPSCKDFQYLWCHSLNELVDSEQRATAISLASNGIPNCTLRIPTISPFYLGQLFMLLEKVVCLLGKLYGVNAFNQPGVEESKEYTRAMLGKSGERYENKRIELASYSDPGKVRIA